MHDPLQGAQPPQGQAQHQHQPYDPNLAAAQHFGVVPLPPQQDGWGKIGIVMVALAVIFAGGVAYFIATSGSSKGKETTALAAGESSSDAGAAAVQTADAAGADPAEPAAADEVAEPISDTDAGPGDTETATDPEEVGGQIGLLRANGEVDRPAGLVSLAIESEPTGATVIRKRDGVRLGATPYRYEVESSRAEVAFVLKLEGYRSTSVSMPGDQDSVRQVVLLPGSGGVEIPVAANKDSDEPIATKPTPVAVKVAPKKSTPTKVSTPKRPTKPKTASKPKKPSKPKAADKPAKKPKGGKVDYKAEPIPL